MKCCCDEETAVLKVEGDVEADPIWCNECSSNLELEDIPISSGLKVLLRDWAIAYAEWMDWDKDELLLNGIELENDHNKRGEQLTEMVKKELEGKYEVAFSLSTMGRSYSSNERN